MTSKLESLTVMKLMRSKNRVGFSRFCYVGCAISAASEKVFFATHY